MAKTSKSKKKTKKKSKKKVNSKKKTVKKTKKPKKVKKITIIAIILLFFLIGVALGLIKINFLIDEEIIIKVSPQYESINTKSNSEINVYFEAEFQNYPLCVAECSYFVKDVSKNQILFEGEFDFSNYNVQKVNKKINVPEYGYGQKVIQYSVSCKNKLRSFCPTNNNSFNRIATKTINYEPNDEQKEIETSFRQKINDAKDKLNEIQNNIDKINFTMNTINKKTSALAKEEMSELERKRKDKEFEINSLINSWNNQEFSVIKLVGNNNLFIDDYSELENQSNKLKEEIYKQVENTNYLVNITNNIKEEKDLINSILATGISGNVDLIENNYNDLIVALTSNFLLDLTTLSDLNKKTDIINEEYRKIKMKIFYTNYSDDPYIIDYVLERNLYCINNMDCNLSDINYYFNDSVNNIAKGIKLCEDTNKFQINDSNETLNVRVEKLKIAWSILEQLNIKTNYSILLQRKNELITEINNELLRYNETSSINYYPKEYNQTLFNDIQSVYSTDLINKKQIECNEDYIYFPNTNLEYISVEKLDVNTTFFNLSKQKDICCLYEKCEPCNEEKTIPLILIHGHSFSGRSSAYTSTEIFTQLEKQFEEDENYLITGILNPQSSEDYTSGELGKQNVPAVFKTTYYVDYYKGIPGFIIQESKSNNIDSYAIRLNEIVEYVKDITGSEKVNILAHSMGGLVSRRYIQVFGESSVNKFIMVGTPNHGIDDKTTTLCKIFGSEAECDDMNKDSLFMSN